jgi:hypothetical protein
MAYASIDKSALFFKNKRFTGNNTSGHAITGVGFQPDMVWFKNASSTQNWRAFDVLRGATYRLVPNENSANAAEAQQLQAFGSDGFTVGADGSVNGNTETMNAFCWKAGTSVSGTTTGSGTGKAYSGSVSTTAGFSIIKYLGNGSAGHTIPHHLSAVPKMIIVKKLTSADWQVYHVGIGNTKKLSLNTTGAASVENTRWNSTTPTSSVFTLGTSGNVNANDVSFIAYCFAEKTGFSKFGTFEGNGTAYPNSPFIYTGFKPKLFLWKNADDSGGDDHWNFVDSEAQQYNARDGGFYWLDSTYTESNFSGNEINFLSNGVKINPASAYHNQSGATYVYMAFGQSIVGSNNIPATAR